MNLDTEVSVCDFSR